MIMMDAIRIPVLRSTADAKHGTKINCGGIDNFNADEAKEILDSLLQNKELEILLMDDNGNFGSLESCRALGKLVQTSTTLKHLSLNNVNMDGPGLRLIVEGIVNSSQSVLEVLALGYNWDFGLVPPHAWPNKVTNKVDKGMEQAIVRAVFISLEVGIALGKLVRTSTNLKHLYLQAMQMQGEHMKHIVEGILNNSQSTLETLDLRGNRNLGSKLTICDDDADISEGVKQLTNLLLGNTRALVTLVITYIDFSAGELKSISKALASNTTLINLTFGDYGMQREQWMIFFDSLKWNKCLQKVDLLELQYDDFFEDLMQIFHVNYTIQEMPFIINELKDERRSQLEGMLLRNQRLGEYMNTLQKLQFVKPRIGRLFLFGSPFAGKTTLQTSMVGTQAGWMGKVKSKAKSILQQAHCVKPPNERTQGIEVQSLKAPMGEQVALWDMAGQEEYRALHDNHHLFPEMSQACVFLFVFCPLDKERKCNINDATLQLLRKELHYWLGFINSNSRKVELITPMVMIVLTHLDRLSNENADSYVAWAKDTVQDVREFFSGQVEIHNTIQAVNSLSQKDALRVVKQVVSVISNLFPKLPEVPAACEKVNSMLTKWVHAHKAEPIIMAKKFSDLCQENVPELKDLLQIDVTKIPNELQASVEKVNQFWLAVVSYLHDSGCIINFLESKWIVVDINWLGQTFLGQLFNPKSQTMQEMITYTSDGIVPKHQLENFLSKFIKDGKYTGISTEVLVELMKALKICEDAPASLLEGIARPARPQYFMPCTLVRTQTEESKLQWTKIVHDHQCSPVYTGLRLRCKDRTRTFFSPGLFLRYQVHLLKQLLAQTQGESDLEYRIKWNLIHVKHSGIEMFIESSGKLEDPQYGGDDDYVDILMMYYGQPMSGKQHKYPYGVSELQTFCTSREGCPGVSLEEAILRPECVKRLTPCVYRRKQAISRDDLKKKMVAHLFAEMGASSEIWNDRVSANTITNLFDSKIYRQRFEAIHDLDEEEVKATTLLDDLTDIQNAIDNEQKSTINQVNAIYEVAAEVHMEIKLAVDVVEREPKIPVSTSSQPSTSSSVTRVASDHLLDGLQNKDRPVTLGEFQTGLQNFKTELSRSFQRNKNEMLKEVDCMLGGIVKDMRMIQQLQEQQIGMMKNIEQQIAVLPWEQSDSMPRFPYFTRYDVNLRRKILALKIVGEALMLHFMCEEPNQPHFVKEQKGYDITRLNPAEWAKTLRPLISASVDIFLVLVKVAAHVGAGIGNAIPNFSGWEGAIPLTAVSSAMETVLNEIKETDSNAVDHDKKSAWKCLLDVIVKPMLQAEEFSKEFGLYQVQYKSNPGINQSSASCYWVCRKCREKASKACKLVEHRSPIKPLDGVVQESDPRHPWR